MKEENTFCYILTLILGICLIFPFLCMCCKWWDKIAYPAYEISVETYQELEKMILSTKINTLNLIVYDNSFDKQKSELLQRMIKKSTLKSFNFENKAIGYDYKNMEKTNFKTNMAPIKEILLESSYLQWQDDSLWYIFLIFSIENM